MNELCMLTCSTNVLLGMYEKKMSMVVDPDPGKKRTAGTYFDSGNR